MEKEDLSSWPCYIVGLIKVKGRRRYRGWHSDRQTLSQTYKKCQILEDNGFSLLIGINLPLPTTSNVHDINGTVGWGQERKNTPGLKNMGVSNCNCMKNFYLNIIAKIPYLRNFQFFTLSTVILSVPTVYQATASHSLILPHFPQYNSNT